MLDIHVDGVFSKTWTSSGTTSSFETVSLDSSGQVVELRGDLGTSEWLSVFEVCKSRTLEWWWVGVCECGFFLDVCLFLIRSTAIGVLVGLDAVD